MTGKEFQDRVEKEAGFSLLPKTVGAYAGIQIVPVVCDLTGTIIREATKGDIEKWNEVWNRIAKNVFASKTSNGD
jgi:hypothetical protein